MARHALTKGLYGKGHSKEHPGFAAVQADIAAEQGVSKERAGAILGSRTREASESARKKNPRLNRVKGRKRRK